jgi:UPF0716 protein FxsA
VLVIFGGAFLLTPGFISDVLGLLLLLPPTRAVVRRVLVRRLAHRMTGPMGGPRPGVPSSYDVEGRAVDLDTDRIDPPSHPR